MLTVSVLESLKLGTLMELPPLLKGLDPTRKLYFKTLKIDEYKKEYSFDMEYMGIQLGGLLVKNDNGVVKAIK